jgi:hypothetical protein
MPGLIDISAVPHIEWETAMDAVAAVIAIVCPNARVHSEWVLEFDPQTGLGKITSLLRPESGPDSGKVHAWLVGFGSVSLERGTSGDFEYIGGAKFHYWLTLDVWGFFDYAGLENSWAVAQQEARLVTAMIYRNMTLGIENPFISRAEPPEWAQGDVVPFSDGENLIVMQGQMRILIEESL